jgi:hypothetical protein
VQLSLWREEKLVTLLQERNAQKRFQNPMNRIPGQGEFNNARFIAGGKRRRPDGKEKKSAAAL